MKCIAFCMLIASMVTIGCNDSAQSKYDKFKTAAADCTTDNDCADGFVCTEKKCLKGVRTAAELAAKAKAKADKAAAERAKKLVVKPGEGRLRVRVCPGFKNTPEAIGTIIAIHQQTKKKHFLHLARETRDLAWETEFLFPSLPLGTYDVTADYGIQKGGRPDVIRLKCDKKAKQCRDESVREMTVVLPKDEPPPPPKREDGKRSYKVCDWAAE
jgi:hypothetical protein